LKEYVRDKPEWRGQNTRQGGGAVKQKRGGGNKRERQAKHPDFERSRKSGANETSKGLRGRKKP